MLHAYLFFHCNLAFSSIEEGQHADVIDRCYSPMLDLAEIHGIPIGVEATGWTLERIQQLRPDWLERFKRLLVAGRCEFIGSGYAQIIGPLVPAPVNAANQRLGQAAYEQLLGLRPTLALINEQAYSAGILEHYVDNGYTGIIMEWDNPRLAHPEWPTGYRYAPQTVQDMRGRTLKLLWNQSMVFQHLQRVVHDELDTDDYLRTTLRHNSGTDRVLCIYGNDAEIFDFRPGRFETEAPIARNEWETMAQTLLRLKNEADCAFCLPEEVFALALPHSGNSIRLESPAVPVPVKKQPKYNLLRWAVTGRDDFRINSRCRALTEALCRRNAGDDAWRELCFLWASDFRTHITEKRWREYRNRLQRLEDDMGVNRPPTQPTVLCRRTAAYSAKAGRHSRDAAGRMLTLETDAGTLRLNLRKGLAIDTLAFPGICSTPLIGTLPHGFFDTVSLAADFFSGHVIMEIPGRRKRTDLAAVEPQITETSEAIHVECAIPDFYCPMRKRVSLSKIATEIMISHIFDWPDLPPCSLRLFHLTLLPGAFDAAGFRCTVHNGGSQPERFDLHEDFDHGQSVSFMVSASHALGMTEGYMELGDSKKNLQIAVYPSSTALTPMILNRKVDGHSFTRLSFSCREFDETVKMIEHGGSMEIGMRVTAIRSESRIIKTSTNAW